MEQIDALYQRQAQYVNKLPKESLSSFDNNFRHVVCEWAYNVIDYFGLDRSIVVYAMCYLDTLTLNHTCDSAAYRLASLSSLFLSIKIHGCNGEKACRNETELGINLITTLSQQDEFGVGHITIMERVLCHGLKWRLHPVIPAEFVNAALENYFLERSIYNKEVKKVALFCTELAVCDVYFSVNSPNRVTASQIAIASIQVAFKICCNIDIDLFLREDQNRIKELVDRLMALFMKSGRANEEIDEQEECSQLTCERDSIGVEDTIRSQSDDILALDKPCSSEDKLHTILSHGSDSTNSLVSESDDAYSPICVSTSSDLDHHCIKQRQNILTLNHENSSFDNFKC